MGFINHEVRETAVAQKAERDRQAFAQEQQEIDSFCDPAHIEKIVLAIRADVERSYLVSDGRPVTFAMTRRMNWKEAKVTNAVSKSHRCQQVVFDAVKAAEPATSQVEIQWSVDFDEPYGTVRADFNPPLS